MKRFFQSQSARTHMKQIAKFLVIGAFGALCIDIGGVALFTRLYGSHPLPAGIVSSLLSITFVFVANRYLTFKAHSESLRVQVAKFVLVYGTSLGINIALYSVFLWMGFIPEVGKACAILLGAFWNYSFSHFFVFRKKPQPGLDLELANL